MITTFKRLAGGLAVLLVVATPAAGELDDLAFALHRDQHPQVRWDNIEGGPFLHRGDAPRFEPQSGNHVLQLAAGETATLWLPGGADVLLRDRWDRQTAGSNGFADLRVARSQDGAAWLRVVPDRRAPGRRTYTAPDDEPYLVRLAAPADAAVRVAAFRARRVDVPEHPLYRADITPETRRTFAIADTRRAVRELRADGRVRVRVEGPTRLALAHRRLARGPRADLDTPYSLTVRRDGRRVRVVPGRTRVQRVAVARLDGAPVAVSTAERVYVDVPPGRHTVTVATSAPILLRVLRRREPDYLLGRPATWRVAPADLYAELRQATAPDLSADLPTAELEQALRAHLRTPEGAEQGPAAVSKLAGRAAEAPFPDAVDRGVADLRGGHTFWRDLTPTSRVVDAVTAYVRPGRLRDPGDRREDPPVVMPQEMPELAAGLRAQRFVRLGGRGPDRLRYPLADRSAPSRLRLSVARTDGPEPAVIDVAYGDGTRHRVRVEPDRASGARAAPSPTLAALRRLARDGQGGTPALRGPLSPRYAALGESAPLIAAGVVELPLWRDVGRIEVRHVRGPSVRVGLAYLAGKPFRLDARGYRHAVRRIGGDAAARARFAQQLRARRADAQPPAAPSPFADWLDAHWQPLLDLLAARRATYADGIHDRGHRFDAPDRGQGDARADRLERRANRLTEAGAWGAAADAWGRVAGAASGATWRRAEMARIDALQRAGSEGLAERLLRGFHIHSDDPAMRYRAFKRLRDLFADDDRTDLLVGAYVVQQQGTGRVADLGPVVELLLDNGSAARALDLAALLPDRAVDASARVRAYRAGGWDAAYRRALGDLPAAAADRWRARDALRAGDRPSARRLLDQHPANAAWLRALERGLAIADALGENPDDASRARWLAWHREHPGARRFTPAMRLVTEAAAQPTLRSVRRGTPVTTALATPGRPVKLTAPAGRLRITFRLRMPAGAREQEGWAQIRAGDAARTVPVTAAGPATGLEPVGGGYAVGPGRTRTVDLDGTTGRVTLTVNRPMLIQVERAEPVQALPVLPTPWPGVRAALAAGAPGPLATCAPAVSFIEAGTGGARRVCGAPDGLVSGLANLGGGNDLTLSPPWYPSDQSARRLAACSPPYTACSALATEIYARERLGEGDPELDRLGTLVAPHVGWERVEQVVASAGIRTVEVAGWQPHSPLLRARAPFLGDLPDHAQVLTGPGSLYIDFLNQAPTTLLLDLRTVDMPTYPSAPADVRYRLDDGRWRTVRVGPDGRQVAIDVGPGRHAVEVTVTDPLSERALVVAPWERRGGRVEPLRLPVERSYEVAARGEPAVFAVDGPTLVRIDRYSEAGITSAYRRVPAGREEVRVEPRPGQREGLVRVYALRHLGAVPSSAARYDDARPDSSPAEQGLVVADRPPVPAPVGDRGLHGQEDGTTSLTLGYRLRRQAEDEPGGTGDRDGFLALRAAHRYYDPHADRYVFAGLTGRSREDGRPTLGAETGVLFPDRTIGRAAALPLDLSMRVSGFAQDTEAAGVEASLAGRVAARHRRQVAERTWISGRVDAFARYLTRDSGLAGGETADADVFTRYKRDHPVGWGLRVGAEHAPYLDTRLYGRLGVRSNADLWIARPDNVYAEGGIRQVVAGLRLDLSYRETRYLADDDRENGLSTRRIGLDVGYDLWRPGGDRLEVTADLRHDVRRTETSFGVFVTWHFGGGQRAASRDLGNGRLYRDFRPNEESFRTLREGRAPGWEVAP